MKAPNALTKDWNNKSGFIAQMGCCSKIERDIKEKNMPKASNCMASEHIAT